MPTYVIVDRIKRGLSVLAVSLKTYLIILIYVEKRI